MDLYPKNKITLTNVKKFVIIFYIVGLLGFVIPYTKGVFIFITPFALLLNTYLLMVYHKAYKLKDILLFLVILLSGFTIEVIGVKTGLIFGHYTYGNALGIKLFETPLLIGINWLFLTYTATAITGYLKVKKWLVVIVAPFFMVIYDLILEQVAPKMNMWSWQNSEVPIKNYVAWYAIAMVFVALLTVFKIDTKNPLAPIIFISQFIFFGLLLILL
jgi:putative membrane protein